MPSDEKADLAVLSCNFPAEVQGPFGAISSRSPRSHQQWESHGFASAEADGGSRPLVALKGTCFQPSGSRDLHFDLDVSATTSMNNGWRGVSGAPVFVDGMIKGVIVECPEYYENGRLRAMRVSNLYDDQTFCDTVELSGIVEYNKLTERFLVIFLKNSKSLCRALSNKLKIDAGYIDKESLIVAILLQNTAEEALVIFENICKSWDRSAWPDDVTPESICEFIFRALPCLVDSGLIRSLGVQDSVSWKPDPVNIHTEHMAEIAMASYDKRAVQVEPVMGDGAAAFRAKHAIPAPPTEGLHFDAEAALVNITNHIVDEYAPAVESGTDNGAGIKIANRRMAQLSDSAESVYITFLCDQDRRYQNNADLMCKLKQRFENLFVIPRSANEDVILNEGTIPSSIKYFLTLAARTK
ncbi:hypothetical protein GE253_25140 [Niveispirillum sp. SYP-B3756]|uniref:hypothetical protein n=1 Tax=Niveispirillum sp. SYP-B3756 TaxID=2662178 RepID=UPI0012927942|nr:hypothetical protein [Niveispirillum sp. SYP-B3756]MQP68602.1 hypothetical protein [Niveispirillum sp. SYP-B3756]